MSPLYVSNNNKKEKIKRKEKKGMREILKHILVIHPYLNIIKLLQCKMYGNITVHVTGLSLFQNKTEIKMTTALSWT